MASDGGGASGANDDGTPGPRGRLSNAQRNHPVPFAPGGGTDLLARAYAQILEKKYGKTFVIESLPGGGTTLAATARPAKPDGYTLMQGTSGTMAMNPTSSRVCRMSL